ncbi:transposase [Priestia megaterium]
MESNTQATFILQLPLHTTISDENALNKYFELSRKLYNVLLGEGLKRLNLMRQSKEYQNIKKLKKKEQSKAYKQVNENFGFTKNDLIKFSTPLRVNEFKQVDSNTTQKLAQRAFAAVEKMLYGKAKRVNFKRNGEMDSVEGSSNRQGIKYREGYLIWRKLKIRANLKEKDYYAHEALTNKIKYCRVVRKIIRGKLRFFMQLSLAGIPPRKIDNETGMFKCRHSEGSVGIDIGIQTIAISSEKEVKLLELAPEVNDIYKQKRILQRKMNRQRRANNPHKYNENGTIKKGNKDKWVISKNYLKIRYELAELQRKQSNIRRQSHYRLANWIVSLGDAFYIEQMNYKGLQKRKKETTTSKKTGKYKSKKRFGKSLANKAPSMLLTLLKQKISCLKLDFNTIDTYSFKASQYNHFTDKFIKKKLSDRWNEFDCGKIQRDLYSAYLIMNSRSDLKTTDRKLCFSNWDSFKQLHDIEIERLRNEDKTIASMGI